MSQGRNRQPESSRIEQIENYLAKPSQSPISFRPKADKLTRRSRSPRSQNSKEFTHRDQFAVKDSDNIPATILSEYKQHLKNNGVNRMPDFGPGFQKYVSEHSEEFSELVKKNLILRNQNDQLASNPRTQTAGGQIALDVDVQTFSHR